MNKAIILQHAPHMHAGRIIPIFRDMGIPMEVRYLDRGDEVPTRAGDIRALVVLDGPARLTDSGGEAYPYLQQTTELLKDFIQLDRPVLGIGLGAQLLAHAAGAKVYPNTTARGDEPGDPAPEFGWGPVTFPFPGGTDPIVFGLMDGAPMFHWHFDTFDLPKLPGPANPPAPPAPPPPTGNLLLSSSSRCRNQAFRFKTHLYGFQYHFELTQEQISEYLSHASEPIKAALGADGIEKIRTETADRYPVYARLGDRLVRNFVQYLKVY